MAKLVTTAHLGVIAIAGILLLSGCGSDSESGKNQASDTHQDKPMRSYDTHSMGGYGMGGGY